MMRRLAAACLLIGLAGPALAGGGFPSEVESCDTLAESRTLATALAAKHHAEVTFLDGVEARQFLAALSPSGGVTVFAADHAAVLTLAGATEAQVMVMDNPCGGTGSVLKVDLNNLALALAAAPR